MSLKKILVIDDEKLIRWALQHHLLKEGYEVVVAESAEQGMRSIDEHEPDLILLDNRLPAMTGIEMLEKMQSREKGWTVIMITAYGLPETAARARQLGVYDFINKPFNLEEITSVIKKALAA